MKKLIFLGIFAGIFGLLWATPAFSISIGFIPSSHTVTVNDSFNMDVVVSDVGSEIVSAFDLDINYDPSVISATNVTFGSELNQGIPFFSLQFSDISTLGLVDLREVSLLPDATLDASQPDSFVIATLTFDAIGVGSSPLDFIFDSFNDIKGLNNQVLSPIANIGIVNVNPIPEPSSVILMGLGFAGFGLCGWRIRKKKMASNC